MRVIVCGGRDYADREFLNASLDRIQADWAFTAEWSKYGASAGPRRNKQMLGSGPSLVVAFPGGKGTRNMVKQARNAGIEIMEISA